ncbi:MAG: gamma-glutamyl-gamma-aminobutyrate hydrolase family protein [Desulfobacteraceae bacterium]|nr:gamma-glutamyl-gamma-aminobutyrate hydrolase family protein [Desulfobacteraceae bacterium]
MKPDGASGVPVIGITCSRIVGGAWSSLSRGHYMNYVFSEYGQAIVASGGTSVLLPADQAEGTLEAALQRLDALLLSGGPDLHPRWYGEAPLQGLGDVDEDLDRMELEAARLALEMDLPVLGICRGIQVLNVALGGTLYQDIPRQVEGAIGHAPPIDKGVNSHTVRIEPESLLHAVIGSGSVWVNGKHHQAVKDLGKGLTVCARAQDGIIEAVSLPGKRFVLAVQWHPEGCWSSDPNARVLFEAFVNAAGNL